jgi:hypothetical protein
MFYYMFVKDRRRRSERGEWVPIKILLENLAYVPKSTRNPSLLTRPRPTSYRQAIGLRSRAITATKARKGANKTTREIDDKNSTQKQFISSQSFHRTPGGRVQKTTAGERFRPQILETFRPVTQEQYRVHLQTPSKGWENHS